MAELKKPCYTDDFQHLFYRTRGRRLTNHQYFVLKLTMIFFHTANQTLDSLHNDHSAVCTTFHNCIDLKTIVVGKQLMIMCTCNQLSKRSQHAVTLRKAYKYKICISLPYTHAHGSICMNTCSCTCPEIVDISA